MNKKLTLNIDDSLIDFAHDYSKKTKQSISALFEKFLTSLKKRNEPEDLSIETQELYGLFEKKPLPDKKEMRKKVHEENIT
jgi:hypothetical protein